MSAAHRRATVVWITGRPASGKTSLGRRLVTAIESRGSKAILIDSDEARRWLTPEPSYTAEERMLVYRAMAWAAERLSRVGIVVVVAATAHRRELRGGVEAVVGGPVWVYARCSAEVCRARDPKGLYARAAADPDNRLPGAGEPYEEPDDAYVVDTDEPVDDAVIEALVERVLGLE